MKDLLHLIQLLEKLTNKKVILEFQDDTDEKIVEPPLSKRQISAKKALVTKNFDDLTMEQYALLYFVKKYSAKQLPLPYNSMKIMDLAKEAGIKLSTFGRNGRNVGGLLGQNDAESISPKSENYVAMFEKMSKEKVANLVLKAFAAEKNKQERNSVKQDPRIAGKRSISSLTPEELEALNARLIAKGLKPIGK